MPVLTSSITSCIPELAEHLSMYFALSCFCTSAHAVLSAWNTRHPLPSFPLSQLLFSLMAQLSFLQKAFTGTRSRTHGQD